MWKRIKHSQVCCSCPLYRIRPYSWCQLRRKIKKISCFHPCWLEWSGQEEEFNKGLTSMNTEKCVFSGYGTFNFLSTVHKIFFFLLPSRCFNHVFRALLLMKYDEFLIFIIFHKQLLFFKTEVLFFKPRHVNTTLRPPLSRAVSIGAERARGHLSKHAPPHVCVSIPDYVIGRESRPATKKRGKRGRLKWVWETQ